VRDAANGLTFLELVRSETGLKVKVLKGEEEARLSFRSALAHFELGVGRAVVMDIGGGSLELALSADGLLDRLISLPFGAIRMTEEFLGPRARRKGVRKLREAIRDDIRKALPVRDWRGAQVIGSGAARRSSGPGERSRTSPASISCVRACRPLARRTALASRTSSWSTSSTCCRT
jgi:exopolyphosphatase/guanosine-5'-triphosphate,3'-diphosphate pyrophosphatase